MSPRLSGLTRLLSLNFIWLLLACYVCAVFSPSAGNWIRETVVVDNLLFGKPFTVPLLLLSVLFFNIGIDLAGHGFKSKASGSSVGVVVVGSWLIPVLLLWAARPLFAHVLPETGRELYLGLVLVAAMPIANSSTAWRDNLGGDVGHSVLSLIWSTLLAPFVSVMIVTLLWLDGSMGANLRETLSLRILAGLMGCVVVPIALGALFSRLRRKANTQEAATTSDLTKLINMSILLVLNYSNGALALPQAFGEQRYGQILLAFACVTTMCAGMLLAAKLISRWQKWPREVAKSAALGMSMKNTGTALVLGGSVLAPGSMAILIIVSYTLVQHLLVSASIGQIQVDPVAEPIEAEKLERLRVDSEPTLLTATRLG